MSEESSAWLCHVCDYSSTIGEGQACSECYKVTCQKHLTIETVHNAETGLYELLPVCVECQFKKHL